jgi:hypothetical protein
MATIDISLANSDAVILPISAIYAPIGNGEWVWIVNKDSSVELRAVTLGELTSSSDIAVYGIRPYERVVVAGVYKLQDGERVTIID